MRLREYRNNPALYTRTSESTSPLTHFIHLIPTCTHYRNKNPLGDTFSTRDRHRFLSEIKDLYLQLITLAAIVLIDDANTVWNKQPFSERRATSQCQQ